MKVNFCDLQKQYNLLKTKIDSGINKVLEHGIFIDGPEIKQLEETLAGYLGVKEAITVSSGTDALYLSLLALEIKPEDFVITTPFTFIATAQVIALLRATPIFVDIEADTFNISPEKIEEFLKSPKDPISKKRISLDKIKAIIPVDLFGQCADYDQINSIAKKFNLTVIEDGAQSLGAQYKNKKALNLGDIGCTSFYPAKPLGCFGDGGAIFTNDKPLADKLRCLKNHGQEAKYSHKLLGINGRLDTIQAAILLAKWDAFINQEIALRDQIASCYIKGLQELEDKGYIVLPKIKPGNKSVWAQFSLRILNNLRDEFKDYLHSQGVPSAIHYPLPLHQQKSLAYLQYKAQDFPIAEEISKEIISLPLHPYLEKDEISYVINKIKEFFRLNVK